MPQLIAQGETFDCPEKANLRQVLLAHSIPVHTSTTLSVHNDRAALINCRGLGTFLRLRSGTSGTCAVEMEGEVSPLGWREQARLSLPPHPSGTTRRLACQVKVLGDAAITEFSGFWGQGEQRRIVAKVDALTALCDRLESEAELLRQGRVKERSETPTPG